ncbi:hypothetical protein COV82_05585 [Candidatus Peregrinibacteria bacterium CG11_big_fil_rev_8_21_14_0_20_46_8]|nr:MAG: hypothetical protein COV82_05585 [Candidatus Peregrinibacteria bacterium CG11_big_fil_rev_8_21_14_0_20_46_8]
MQRFLISFGLFLLLVPFGAGVALAHPHPGVVIPDHVHVGDVFSTEGQSDFIPNDPNADPNAVGTAQDPQGLIGFVIFRVIDTLVFLIGSVALIVFIIGGLLLITAEGKEDRLEKGKNAMLYAIIGVVVAFFSFLIVSFVQTILF